jgi:glycerol-3-phosphate dehydrogenase (NAD(P)+)
VQLPIIEQVNAVLFEGMPARQAVENLMLRDKKIENPLLPWDEK